MRQGGFDKRGPPRRDGPSRGGYGGGGGGGYGGDRGGYGGGGGRDSMRTPPVSEGQEIDVTIEAIAAKGDGVAKKDGFVILVPNTKVGDKVHCKVTRVLKNMAFASVTGAGASGGDDGQESSGSGDYGDEEVDSDDGDSENF